MGSWGAIATGRKLEIIDAYFTLCHSNEEIKMLEQDARNCVAFYEHKKEVITSEILCRSVNSNPYNRGLVVKTVLMSLSTSEELLCPSKIFIL